MTDLTDARIARIERILAALLTRQTPSYSNGDYQYCAYCRGRLDQHYNDCPFEVAQAILHEVVSVPEPEPEPEPAKPVIEIGDRIQGKLTTSETEEWEEGVVVAGDDRGLEWCIKMDRGWLYLVSKHTAELLQKGPL